ncbi:YkvA family protein [Pedobacter gandavensis]|uniref:YkvA family protein n=1 Tax=Pedobacter gandavensis TaxID=2679963 RepID=UPI00292FE95F|nr:YkvA family protein [Pedobacter gandavensis]
MNKENKKTSFLNRMKEKVKRMRQDTLALYYAYSDQGTPWTAKALIWLTIGYLLSPIDLIPDFIPAIGLLDDLIIVPLLIILSVKLIPKGVWNESLRRAEHEPMQLKKANWLFAAIIITV